MFTIKLYSDAGRQRILAAESFTILRGGDHPTDNEAEITLHQKNPFDDARYDIRLPTELPPDYFGPPVFQKAIIENAAGRTTEIIAVHPGI